MAEEQNPDVPPPPGAMSGHDMLAGSAALKSTASMDELTTIARSAAMAATQAQAECLAAFVESTQKLEEVRAIHTQANAAMTQIVDSQAVVATKSDHIQKAQEHADKVRADLDRALTAATQQATEAEGNKTRAQSSADQTVKVLADVRAAKAAADSDAAAIATAKKLAEQSAEVSKGLSDKAEEVDERLRDYEEKLATLEKRSREQLETIISLLPGATSAGLAHAFDSRRNTFIKPHDRWQWIFVGSVGMIVVIAITGLWQVYKGQTVPTFEELLRLWMARLPVAGALVWLAMHASREAALAKRLEEDYGYKAAIASSFLGFHKQMSEIGSAIAANEPLKKLCGDTLTTIASPPGRLYDNHKLVVSPVEELAHVAKSAAETAATVKRQPKA